MHDSTNQHHAYTYQCSIGSFPWTTFLIIQVDPAFRCIQPVVVVVSSPVKGHRLVVWPCLAQAD